MAERILIMISVELDPIPGVMHTPESAHEVITQIMNERLSHYSPIVHNPIVGTLSPHNPNKASP